MVKHIFSEEFPAKLPDILRLLRDLIQRRSGLEYLETILRYVTSGTDRIENKDLKEIVNEVFDKKGGDIMPTIAEQWIEQGIQQGMQQGMIQGMIQDAREMVLEVVAAKFGIIPEDVAKQIRMFNDREVLRSLLREAIFCSDMEGFRDLLKQAGR